MYNEMKDDLHIRVYRKNKQTGSIEVLTKGGFWKNTQNLELQNFDEPTPRIRKELQDALDEVPNADPYENMCIIFGKRSTGHLYYGDLDYFKGTCGIMEVEK